MSFSAVFRETRRTSLTTTAGRKRRHEHQQSLSSANYYTNKRKETKAAKLLTKEQQALDAHLAREKEQEEANRAAFAARADELADHISANGLALSVMVDPDNCWWRAYTPRAPGSTKYAWDLALQPGCAPTLKFWGRPWDVSGYGEDMTSVLKLMSQPAHLCAGIGDAVAAARIKQQGHAVEHIALDEFDGAHRSAGCQLRVLLDAPALDGAVEISGGGVTVDVLKQYPRSPPG